MSEILFDRFEIANRFESGHEYAVVKPVAPESESILNYQVKMLRYNPRPDMIPFEAVLKNGVPELLYDISDLKLISEFSPESFSRMIWETATAVFEGSKLLLCENGFLLNEKHVYRDASTGSLKFIYIPFEITAEPYEKLKCFIRGLHGLCFGNRDLPADIDDVLNGGSGALIGRLMKISRALCPEPSETDDGHIDEEPEYMKEESRDNEKKRSQAVFKLPVNILMAVWAVAEIGLFGMAYFIYKEYVANLPIALAPATAVLIAGALGGGLLLAGLLLPWFKPKRKKGAAQIVEESFFAPPEAHTSAGGGSYETVMLGKSPLLRANLILEGKGGADAVEHCLENERCVVGRNAQFADIHIADMTVGRMHAEINRKEDKWHLRDLGSKNGTKVNGKMLEEDAEHVLIDDDVIEFANVRCIFHLAIRE